MPPRREPPGEVMTNVPTSDALRQAEILAMRALTEQIAQLGRGLEALSNDMREVRDKVIKIEAQELRTAILEIRSELRETIGELRIEHDKRITDVKDDLEKRVDGLEKDRTEHAAAIARIRGMIIPVTALASSLLAGALAFGSQLAANYLNGGGHPIP